ncbi:MAG: hypothetical protein AAB217_13245 [Chloroflexota bacterium]
MHIFRVQFVGEVLEFFASPALKYPAIHGTELGRQCTSIVRIHHVVAHIEQDIVLLEDVVREQVNVLPGRFTESCSGGGVAGSSIGQSGGHFPGETSRDLMLMQHDADRSAVAGNAPGFKYGEKQVLFLAVVARVGEESDEFDALRKRGFGEFTGLFESVHEPAENSDHAKDDLVLGSKNRHRTFRMFAIHIDLQAGATALKKYFGIPECESS